MREGHLFPLQLVGIVRSDDAALRSQLFQPLRPGFFQLSTNIPQLKEAIFAHPGFTAFTPKARKLFTKWQTSSVPLMKGLARDGHPKPLIETISEDLLATCKTAPLLDAYDVHQHLMDYGAGTMQDDCYLIADAGWKAGALPREIRQVKTRRANSSGPGRKTSKRANAALSSTSSPPPCSSPTNSPPGAMPSPPTKAGQTAIATVLSGMDGELAVLEQRREKTRALKQAMMQELLTGRTRLI